SSKFRTATWRAAIRRRGIPSAKLTLQDNERLQSITSRWTANENQIWETLCCSGLGWRVLELVRQKVVPAFVLPAAGKVLV
ncbi:MAG: hypothetical protein ACK5PJ_07820, partial [Ralstonia sp.]